MQRNEKIVILITTLAFVFFHFLYNTFDVVGRWKAMKHEWLVQDIEPIQVSENDRTYRSEGNLNSGGFVLETDDYDYVIFDHLHMEKLDKNKERVDILISQSGGTGMGNLQMVGKWLYYTQGGLYRMDMDSSETVKLYEGGVCELYVLMEEIYLVDYENGLRLFKMGINGEDLKVLGETKIFDLLLVDNGFYAIVESLEGKGLAYFDFSDEKFEIIDPNLYGGGMIEKDGYIYYSDYGNNQLRKINLETLEKNVVIDAPVSYFVMLENESIVYSLWDKSNDLQDSIAIYRKDSFSEPILLDGETLRSTGMLNIWGDSILYESDYKEAPFGNMLMGFNGKNRVMIRQYN